MALEGADAVRLARERDLVAGAGVSVSALGGGVSNDALLVDDGEHRVVVKRALGRLRTAIEWHASPARALDEAAALRIAAAVTPDRVPAVLAVEPPTATIAVSGAPPDWCDWKVELLAGRVRPAVGSALGATLGAWHAATHDRPDLLGELDGMDRMATLRIEPFHNVIAERHPDLEGRIGEAVRQLHDVRRCLVHGDFSPKNVLAAPPQRPEDAPGEGDRLWVIDFEVAHLGNPVFDLAFLHSHLLLKGLAHATGWAADGRTGPRPTCLALRETAAAFTAAYRDALADSALDADTVLAELGLHTGCLVLARVDGTSLVDYLDEAATSQARTLGRGLIAGELALSEAWDEVTGRR